MSTRVSARVRSSYSAANARWRGSASPDTENTIDRTPTYYVAEGPESGCCGHRHARFEEATRCIERDGLPDRSVLEVQDPAATGTPTVHETATVGHGVCMGHDVLVSAYSIVGAGVVLGEASVLSEHVVLRPRTVIGPRSRIDSFAVIGGDPQDLGFDRQTESRVTLGEGVVLREGVTIHRSTIAGGETVIEDGVYIMANGHVAHDCHVGKRAILANNVLLGGHVEIGEGAMLGGAAGVHQYTRIGQGCMIGGNATATRDVPPFTMLAGRNGLAGLNVVGLRRRGVSKDDVADLKNCFRAAYGSDGDPRDGAAMALAAGECGQSEVGRAFLEFFAGGTRGFVRPRRDRGDDQ